MRIPLVLSTFALTALVFFFAVQTVAPTNASEMAVATPIELETLQAEFDTERAALNAQIAETQSAAAAQRDQLTSDLDKNVQQLDVLMSENATLVEKLASAEAEMSNMDDATGDTDSVINALKADIEAGQNQVEALQATIANLELERTDAMDAALYDVAELEEKAAAFAGEVATLTNALAQRDAEIANLKVNPSAVETPVLACQDRITTAMNGTKIAFEANSATITMATFPVLESIAEIAIDCTNQGLSLEIEGHTDSLGGDATNLLLSNGRANTIASFLADRGVPKTAMRAVGFGANDPIADNATEAGRAQNQRVAFDWEQS